MTRPAPDSALATRPVARWAAALAAGVALAAASTCAHAAWDMQQLMESLAQAHSGRATFVETKRIAMLDKPVESSGELLFVAPDRLEKRTLKPKPESMVVDGDELSIERGNRNYRLRLQSYPELAAFIDSIRGTLSGNRKTLERDFRLGLSGTASAWTLQLFPFDEKMKAVVRRILITGAQGQVNTIEIDQADCDSSVMVIEKSTAR
ncbi:MAG: LolA-related protein [Ramlibacter sp.]